MIKRTNGLIALAACRTYGIVSENSTGRRQIFDDSPTDSGSIGQEAAEIWATQVDSQPIPHKSDRLLDKPLLRGVDENHSAR